MIEKSGGCPEMICYACKMNFCWTCGFQMGGLHNSINTSCRIVNVMVFRRGNIKDMLIQSIPIRIFFFIILGPFFPFLMLVGVLCSLPIIALVFPFYPIRYMNKFIKETLKIDNEKENGCCIYLLLMILMYPFALLIQTIVAIFMII